MVRVKIESLNTASLKSNQISPDNHLLSQFRLKPQHLHISTTTPTMQSPQTVNHIEQAMTSLKKDSLAESIRSICLNDLLSTLPKPTIPTPLQPLKTFALFSKLPSEI
jgi:hypothetical protein